VLLADYSCEQSLSISIEIIHEGGSLLQGRIALDYSIIYFLIVIIHRSFTVSQQDNIHIHSISLPGNIVDQWLDSFDPAIRTYTANFVINTLRKYSFDLSGMSDDDAGYARLLLLHFSVYVRRVLIDQFPDRIIAGYSFTNIDDLTD
jgi:hypothetical protein